MTLSKVHASVAAGHYSYEQLMRDTLTNIERFNPSINAIVALQDPTDLIRQAQHADQTPATGKLHGIPIALKDLVSVKGIVSSFGSPLLHDNIPSSDDLMAERIRSAGAIIIGKTNTPEFGFGSQTYNTVYGATATPYDTSKTSGGSSGGAAAALASGLLLVADGSDMMGSLRNPAAFCNVYGFRPTYGLVPNEPNGDVFMHQLSTLGPMARNVEDLACLLDVMAGPDNRHPHSVQNVPNFTNAFSQAPERPQRIGWLADWGGQFPMESGVLDICEQALKVFENAGYSVELLAAPFESEALWQSWTSLRGFALAGLLKDFYDNKDDRQKLKPEAIFEIETGLQLSATDISKASSTRAAWYAKANQLFDSFDVLVLPSCQVFPFDKSQHWPSHIGSTEMSSYHRWMEVVVPASLLGLPAINVPAGFSSERLPMGMQLIGARNTDASLLQLAQLYHEATQWPQRHPPSLS